MHPYPSFKQAIDIVDIYSSSVALFALLLAVVARKAQRLEWTRPKKIFASAMGCHMVTHSGFLDDLIVKAHDTQRMR
ncbi:hypothetical protein ASH09_04730 [Agrobacterium radiobacter]|nr:hypothetical protein ASH09_04730 [Agrobacterium radiobacter]